MAAVGAAAFAAKGPSPRIRIYELLKAQPEPVTFNRFYKSVGDDPLFKSRSRVRSLLHRLHREKLVSVICPPGGPRNAEGLQMPFFYQVNPFYLPDAVAKRREFAKAAQTKAAERKVAEATALAKELVKKRQQREHMRQTKLQEYQLRKARAIARSQQASQDAAPSEDNTAA